MTYYRITDTAVTGRRIALSVHEFKVVKKTERGVWIDLGGGDKQFILSSARKQFACPSLQLAKESFAARKRRQLRILKSQMDRSTLALDLVEKVNSRTKWVESGIWELIL